MLSLGLLGLAGQADVSSPVVKPSVLNILEVRPYSRADFPNPFAHIPPQCYMETSSGTQNPCQYCHTNGVAALHLGNNNPQAGASDSQGNLQKTYSFSSQTDPKVPNASINPWRNLIAPGELQQVLDYLQVDAQGWDIQQYVRQDNWQAAYNQRPEQTPDWDTGINTAFRVFPALSPADLPAQPDGFVRSGEARRGLFQDGRGWNTGWRAVNFMPYGIFTPQSGSVSGIYIRLPTSFMQNDRGQFDLGTYQANLDLLRDNIQNRPLTALHYVGRASNTPVSRGLYPRGTEFAHPLHYVDLQVDGQDQSVSPFPGTRARRVKEIRWMYKLSDWDPEVFGHPQPRPEITDDGPEEELGGADDLTTVLANKEQGFISNGAGWLLGGWIENKDGALRAQTPSELIQCVACHSGNPSRGGSFTSGTGNTVDSTWAMPRQWSGPLGWQEMNYLGYRASRADSASEPAGRLTIPEPINRSANVGEYRYFLDHVVGASLFGEMPATVEAFLKTTITKPRGYSADWPDLSREVGRLSARSVVQVQQTRQRLMRELTAKGDYLDQGVVRPELFLPAPSASLEQARRYRMIVASQRFDFGKEAFDAVPLTYRYFRTPDTAFTHQNGRPYLTGETVTDRPIDPETRAGITPTLIDQNGAADSNFVGQYVPLLK